MFGFHRRLIFCGWTAVNAELSEQVRQDKRLIGPSCFKREDGVHKKAARIMNTCSYFNLFYLAGH